MQRAQILIIWAIATVTKSSRMSSTPAASTWTAGDDGEEPTDAAHFSPVRLRQSKKDESPSAPAVSLTDIKQEGHLKIPAIVQQLDRNKYKQTRRRFILFF